MDAAAPQRDCMLSAGAGRRRHLLGLLVALLSALTMALTVAPPAHAGFTAAISGRVSGAGDNPVEVKLFRLSDGRWDRFDDVEAQTDGSYVFARVPAGAYRLMAISAGDPPTAPAYYGGHRFEDADTLQLSRGDDVDDADIALGRTSSISGTLVSTDPELPVEDSVVIASPVMSDEAHHGGEVTVLPDGSFTIPGLSPGEYDVWAVPPPDSSLARTANPVPVALGVDQSAGGVTVSVSPGSGFGGRVTAGGGPVEFAIVHAYRETPRGLRYEDSRETGSSGFYFFAGLPSGRYVITASPWDGAHGSSRVDGVVLQEETAPDVSFALPAAATISGNVTGPDGEPVAGATVWLDWLGPEPGWSTTVVTDDAGHFVAEGLTPGSYRPRLPATGSADYLGTTGSTTTVSAGGSSTASLVVQRRGRITGITTGPDGPLSEVEVLAYRWKEDDWWLEEVAESGANGSYDVRGLTPGTYRLCFRKYVGSSAMLFYGECYDNVPGDETEGADVVVAANGVVSGVDAELDRDGVALDNLTRPTVSGTPKVGSTLTTTTGTWSPEPSSFTYQWYRDEVPINGATGPSYVLGPSDAGTLVEVRVTAKKPGYRNTHAFADVVSVEASPITNLRRPTVSGTLRVGRTLTGDKGRWSHASTLNFRYSWFVGATRVADATGTTLRLTRAMRGKKVTFKVTATRTGSESVTVASDPTRKVSR